MPDRITISDLEVFFRVGVPDAERVRPQRLQVTIQMEIDFSEAASGDDLNHTVDYAAVARRVMEFGDGREWRLIETVAVDLANLVLSEFRAERTLVEVKKFILPGTRYISARVERSRREGGPTTNESA
jgi:dihydroneopterin aldolase